tara:strand:- start:69099 stop:70817 length:1719 start_codon:yes stop_codon:yes gene_type:complete
MTLLERFKKSDTTRWFFFGIAILAVLALTAMNIYSLYALRDSTIESAMENRKFQLEEYTNHVSHHFYKPFRGIRHLDMNDLEESWEASGRFPAHFNEVLFTALADSLFSDIYYIPDKKNGCHKPKYPVYRFDYQSGQFLTSTDTPKEVCDGFGISISGLNTISLDDYRFNNKMVFDAHRTMTSALINLSDHSVLGHINFVINREYLLNRILQPALESKFGSPEESGLVVWLRDWMQDEILLSSSDDYKFSREIVNIRQRFPGFLDTWTLDATFLKSPMVAATQASLNRNLIVLGFAVFVLVGALFFIFINAQKEREFTQRQTAFLANVTHELKTPLAVMQAAGENISDGRISDGNSLKSYGEHIYLEAVRLRKMIDQLLDVAKVDSGQTVVNSSAHQLDELVNDYYEKNKGYVESKGFNFTINRSSKLPMVLVDSEHVETILGNLIENSIKYSTKNKSISIDLIASDKTAGFSIRDSGVGIPKKQQKNIFKKFYRIENSMTSKIKGHGLGLSIVKNLVELNGGTIDVTSEPGNGSEFSVYFRPITGNYEAPHSEKRTQKSKSDGKVTKEEYA